MIKQTIFIIVVVALVGSVIGRPQFFPGQRPVGFGGGAGALLPGQGGFGSANAAGLGSGSVIGNQALGTGTGAVNAGPGGFGVGLGVGGAIASPIGNVGFGQGQSIALGK